LRGENPELYRRELNSRSKLLVKVQSEDEGAIDRVSVFQAGGWLDTSRFAKPGTMGPAEAVLWNQTGFELQAVKDKSYHADVYSGAPVRPGAISLLKIVPSGSTPEFIGPTILRHSFSMPPKLSAINLVGGTPAPIDYSSSTSENGLTRPFCTTGGDL